MKHIFIFLLIIIQLNVFGQMGWLQKDSLPSDGRYCLGSLVIGNTAYAGLGSVNAELRTYSPALYKFSTETGSWSRTADFPGGGRYGSTAFTLNGKGYICLGVDTSHMWQKDVWEFDPVAETWTKKSDFPGVNRYSACCFVIGNKAYVAGGSYNAGYDYLRDLWCYDPSDDSWVQKASLPVEHKSCAVAFSINGKGYVVGGASYTYGPEKDFYQYDPVSDTWTQLQDFPCERKGALGFVLGDTAYVGTGSDLTGTYNTFWTFTPSETQWKAMAVPPAGFSRRVAGTAFSVGNTGYILAGRSDPYGPFYNTGEMLNDMWAYTPCQLPVARYNFHIDRFAVSFSDSSSGASGYHWNFGDGTFSNEKNPVHTFTTGVFNVCHSVSNGCGQDSVCKTVEVTCPSPIARFFSTYGYPEAQFTDSSITGFLISRLWDFGDSTTSAEANPVHTYAIPGIYHVCLTVTDSCGANTACENIYMLIPLTLSITITPEATNDLLAHFSDLTNGTTYWKWKFGDGDSSEARNPSHLFKEYGTYHVCLTAGNSQYLGTKCDTLLMAVNPSLHVAEPVLVYPNPSGGKVFIRFFRSCASTEIKVNDRQGRQIFSRHLVANDLVTPAQIDLPGLSRGVYFVQVSCDDYKKVWKIVIL
ncbi:MAG: PKD domain-containing protein [Bacteroidota bacterium]